MDKQTADAKGVGNLPDRRPFGSQRLETRRSKARTPSNQRQDLRKEAPTQSTPPDAGVPSRGVNSSFTFALAAGTSHWSEAQFL
jgi:hypothetical protein